MVELVIRKLSPTKLTTKMVYILITPSFCAPYQSWLETRYICMYGDSRETAGLFGKFRPSLYCGNPSCKNVFKRVSACSSPASQRASNLWNQDSSEGVQILNIENVSLSSRVKWPSLGLFIGSRGDASFKQPLR